MKLKLLLIILTVTLFMSACEQGNKAGESKNDAVLIDFLPNMPPQDRLFEDQNFRVGLNVINYEEKLKNVQVCIYDTLDEFAYGIPASVCQDIKLQPATTQEGSIVGSEEKIYFPDKENFYSYKDIEGTLDTNIFAELYYLHRTTATSQMCVKRDIDVNPVGVTCDLSSTETVVNNDAPVKVMSLKKDIFPVSKNKVNIILEIGIENVGSGKVIDKNKMRLSTEEDSILDVKVRLERKNPVFLECKTLYNNRLLFREGKKSIRCEGIIDMAQEFNMEQVKIILDYGYKVQKLTGNINIIDSDTTKI